MNEKIYSTKEAANMLNMSVNALARAVWENRCDSPVKGPGGAYMWTIVDIQHASWRLRRRPLSQVISQRVQQ